MSKSRPKKVPKQTLAGLDEDDVTGADEAAEAMPIEFLRRDRKPAEPETQEKEPPCRKPRRA